MNETFNVCVYSAIRCLDCNDVIESQRVHDWIQCNCGNYFLDGGRDYMRLGFPPVEVETKGYEDLGLVIDMPVHYCQDCEDSIENLGPFYYNEICDECDWKRRGY